MSRPAIARPYWQPAPAGMRNAPHMGFGQKLHATERPVTTLQEHRSIFSPSLWRECRIGFCPHGDTGRENGIVILPILAYMKSGTQAGPRGGVVTQRTANPYTPVRFRARPPFPPLATRSIRSQYTPEQPAPGADHPAPMDPLPQETGRTQITAVPCGKRWPRPASCCWRPACAAGWRCRAERRKRKASAPWRSAVPSCLPQPVPAPVSRAC